jgi:hypothetical protein
MIDLTTLVPTLNDTPIDAFDELSRYRGLALLTLTTQDGKQVVYVDRRIVPQAEALIEAGRVPLGEGDRLDNLAATWLGEARWWWRIADANRALDPTALTARAALGRMLRITLPEGAPPLRSE